MSRKIGGSSEAEADDIVVVNKRRANARRVRNSAQLAEVFGLLGSNINPILTQLAKSRRALFVEGKDFQILGNFARKLGVLRVGNRSEFAVVPVGGFSPERIKDLKRGIETTLGASVVSAAILDRDYRSDAECETIEEACKAFCSFVAIHRCKEIENFLLVPAAIDRAAARRIADRTRRSGISPAGVWSSEPALEAFAAAKRSYVTARYLAERRKFERSKSPNLNETTVSEMALNEFDALWNSLESRLGLIPGKDALSHINTSLQDASGVSVTPTAIVDAMRHDEIPSEMKSLISMLKDFSTTPAPA